MHIIPQKEGESLRKYNQRFSRIQHNILVVHPVVVISAFHQNMRNQKMREEMAMNKVRDVAELYTLVYRCACVEEGRRVLGENAGVEADSEDEDTDFPTKRGRRRNKKRNGKTLFAVEATGDADSAKKVKAKTSGKDATGCGSFQALAAADKLDGSSARYCKIHRTQGHDLQHYG